MIGYMTYFTINQKMNQIKRDNMTIRDDESKEELYFKELYKNVFVDDDYHDEETKRDIDFMFRQGMAIQREITSRKLGLLLSTEMTEEIIINREIV